MKGQDTKRRGPGISPVSIRRFTSRMSSSGAPSSRAVVMPLMRSCFAAIGMISVRNRDKRAIVNIGRSLAEMGFTIVATRGTAKVLERHGLAVEAVHKVAEGWRPNIVDFMKQGEIALVINTPEDGRARRLGAVQDAAVGLAEVDGDEHEREDDEQADDEPASTDRARTS